MKLLKDTYGNLHQQAISAGDTKAADVFVTAANLVDKMVVPGRPKAAQELLTRLQLEHSYAEDPSASAAWMTAVQLAQAAFSRA